MLPKPISVTLFFLFAFSSNAFAQWVNTPTTIRTPNGNVKINTPTYMPMYHYYNTRTTNQKHVYTIVYLNDSTVTTKAILNIDDSVHSLNWGKKGHEASVTPRETKEIYRVDNDGRKISGKPLDSCWIFLSAHDKITTYSITSEIDDPTIAYIQKGDDAPVLLLTEDNVREMVKDNEKALKLVEKKKLLRAIEVYNKG